MSKQSKQRLTTEYLQQRAISAIDYEAFGRIFGSMILKCAIERMEKENKAEAEQIVIEGISATVGPFESPKGLLCVDVTVQTPLGSISMHVGV